ncbi:MAG TPA: divalent-cation tolerance protein CutA [Terriglobales bacterium]|jgi:periplasmic divalent cation tolerance protein|nr:divalent-cation tolerance protein CutA [Terriglobales bacterium]
MTDKILVLTTAASEEDARKIGRALVDRLLAACVNIIPRAGTIYRWEGEIEEAEEWLLLVKTTRGAFDRVREAIVELHSYDVPECIGFPIEMGSLAYLSWIGDSVK